MASASTPKPAVTAYHELDIQATVRAALQRVRGQTMSAALVLRCCDGSPSLNLVLRELQRLAKIGTTLKEVNSRQGMRLFERVKVGSVHSKKQTRGGDEVVSLQAPSAASGLSSASSTKVARIDAADVMGLGDLRDEATKQHLLTGGSTTTDEDDFM